MQASSFGPAPFPTTLWSQVLCAGQGSREALEMLAQGYWRPVYSFLRRGGQSSHDAADLTQEFFVQLLEGKVLSLADRNRGRFRSYLLACLKNFVANQQDRARALKRGGDRTVLSLDIENAERALGAATEETPEREFERQWALAVLDRALARLKEELQPQAREVYSLAYDGAGLAHAEIGRRTGMSEDAVAASVHRSRERLRKILTEEIAATVGSPEEIPGELDELMRAVSAAGARP